MRIYFFQPCLARRIVHEGSYNAAGRSAADGQGQTIFDIPVVLLTGLIPREVAFGIVGQRGGDRVDSDAGGFVDVAVRAGLRLSIACGRLPIADFRQRPTLRFLTIARPIGDATFFVMSEESP